MVLLFAGVYWHQRQVFAPTPVSRLDLLHAIVEEGKLSIDRHRTNTPDLAFCSGHYYSDKAPGTVVAALPTFAATTILLGVWSVPLDSPMGWLVSSWAACAVTHGVALAVGGMALWVWLAGHVAPRTAMVTVLALLLGGMPLYYATAMWSHTLVVGLFGVAIWSINLAGSAPCNWRMALGGGCVGFALASEFTAGIVALGLTAYLVQRRDPGLVSFLGGVGLPLLLIPAYSWATIGCPFELPYSYQARFPEMQEGLFAIKWPNPDIVGRLLLSPERGLFFWSPFLLLVLYGEAGARSRGWWLLVGVPLLHLVVISGRAWDWQAGPCIGPRYLAPMLPLLALPCALASAALPRLALALMICSVALTVVSIAAPTNLIASATNPLGWFLGKILWGRLNPSLGGLIGLPPWAALSLYVLVLSIGVAWTIRLTRKVAVGTSN
jgi:hypothetical protein